MNLYLEGLGHGMIILGGLLWLIKIIKLERQIKEEQK